MTRDAITTKPWWKTSQNGNPRLSFYGLKVTVFPNPRRGGWTVSVGRNAEPPIYSNHETESEARAAAEQEFIQLKASGHFKPPPEPTLREILKGVHSLKELGPQGHERYIELTGDLVREGDRADLICIHDGSDNGASYWSPHSQHKVARIHGQGSITIIATKWWWNRAEPAEGGW
jgi:hypothetical protein